MDDFVRMWFTLSGNQAAKSEFAEIARELEDHRRNFEHGDTQVVAKVLFGGKELLFGDPVLGGNANWVFVDEADSTQISLTSGWRPAFGVGEEILKRIIVQDRNAMLHLNFADGAPNFSGGSVYALVNDKIFRTDAWEEYDPSEVLFESEYEKLTPEEAEGYITWDDVHEEMETCQMAAIELLRKRTKHDFSEGF